MSLYDTPAWLRDSPVIEVNATCVFQQCWYYDVIASLDEFHISAGVAAAAAQLLPYSVRRLTNERTHPSHQIGASLRRACNENIICRFHFLNCSVQNENHMPQACVFRNMKNPGTEMKQYCCKLNLMLLSAKNVTFASSSWFVILTYGSKDRL